MRLHSPRKGLPFILAAVLLAGCAAPEPGPWNRFDAEMARRHVERLAAGIGPRPTGSPGESKARRMVIRSLRQLGLETQQIDLLEVATPRPFPPGRVRLDTAQVLARIPGTDPEGGRILFSAHLDSRDHSCPGANDDASAVGVLLEVARVLSEDPLPSEVLLLVTTAEELGMLGARDFVAGRGVEDLDFVLTLDPVGYGEVSVSPFPGPPALWAEAMFLRAKLRSGARRAFVDPAYLLIPRNTEIPFAADHVAFLEAGAPAMNLSNRLRRTSYHNERDTMDRIETATLETAGRLSLALLEEAANRPPLTRDDPHYLVLPMGRRAFFLSGRQLLALSLAGVFAGLASAVLTLRHGWRRALVVGGFWALVIAFAMLPEKILEVRHGFLYPWWSAQGRYLLMGALAALLAAATAVHLGRALGLDEATPKERRGLMGAAAGLCGLAGAALLPVFGPDAAFFAAWPALLWGLGAMAPARLPSRWRWPGGIVHLALLAAGLWPVLTLARPSLYRQVIEIFGHEIEVVPGLAGTLIRVGLLPAAVFLAALPPAFPLPAGRRTMTAVGLMLLALFAGLSAVPAYTDAEPRMVHAQVTWPGPGEVSRIELSSADRLRDLRIAGRAVASKSTRHTLEGPPSSPLEARIAWTPLGPGRGRLEVEMQAATPARFLYALLEGHALRYPPWEVEATDRMMAARGGQASRFRWEGEVEGEPGSRLTLRAGGWWDGDPNLWEPRGRAAAWDITERTGEDYAVRVFTFPE